MAVCDVYLWAHSLQMWEYSESSDKHNRGGEIVNKAFKYPFADGKSRAFVVAYEHVTKHVANVKNDILQA